jgi:hypothetical protein
MKGLGPWTVTSRFLRHGLGPSSHLSLALIPTACELFLKLFTGLCSCYVAAIRASTNGTSCLAGWLLFAFTAATSVVAMPWVRKHFFAFFYRCHGAFALLIAVAALSHGFGSSVFEGHMPMSIPGVLFWFLDLLIRFFSLNCVALLSDVQCMLLLYIYRTAQPVISQHLWVRGA